MMLPFAIPAYCWLFTVGLLVRRPLQSVLRRWFGSNLHACRGVRSWRGDRVPVAGLPMFTCSRAMPSWPRTRDLDLAQIGRQRALGVDAFWRRSADGATRRLVLSGSETDAKPWQFGAVSVFNFDTFTTASIRRVMATADQCHATGMLLLAVMLLYGERRSRCDATDQ
jgi:iron(III) transport system permease protein